MSTAYIIKTAADRQPSSHKWRHEMRRVAVLEVETDDTGAPVEPSMISERAAGVVAVVETWNRCNVGKTERSEYHRAIRDADDMIVGLRYIDSVARDYIGRRWTRAGAAKAMRNAPPMREPFSVSDFYARVRARRDVIRARAGS